MAYSADPSGEVDRSAKFRSKGIVAVIWIFVSLLLASGAYFGWKMYTGKTIAGRKLEWDPEKIRAQRAFLEKIDKDIAASVKKPERVVEQAFLEYKEFFSKQENLTGITFRNIFERYFPMDLSPAKKARAEIRKSIREDLLPEKFPVSMSEFRSEKQKEAEKLFPLAKIGDKVKVRSARHGNYIGIFNGFGYKGSSVRIDRKVFSMYDLERGSRALFDPTLNEPVKEEYVIRECDS